MTNSKEWKGNLRQVFSVITKERIGHHWQLMEDIYWRGNDFLIDSLILGSRITDFDLFLRPDKLSSNHRNQFFLCYLICIHAIWNAKLGRTFVHRNQSSHLSNCGNYNELNSIVILRLKFDQREHENR